MTAPFIPTPDPEQLLTIEQARIMLQWESDQDINRFIGHINKISVEEQSEPFPDKLTRAEWINLFTTYRS